MILGLEDIVSDGIFGLGYAKDNYFPNFIDKLQENGNIKDRLIAMDISGIKGGISSRLMLGDWHHEVVDQREELVWKPLMKDAKYWEITVDEVEFGLNKYQDLNHGKLHLDVDRFNLKLSVG